MNCPACGRENPTDARFCNGCGSKIDIPAAPTERPSQPLPPPLAAGRYAPLRFLGEGGRKRVYLARDDKLDREVALAIIKTDGLDEAGLTRVKREAQAMARLGDHPNIVTVHDFGEEKADDRAQQPYIVSQYMAGGDLEGRLLDAPDGRLSLEEARRVAIDVCRALEYAHAGGIVHRDLKPGNIWFGQGGTAKLGDFGLAVALEGPRVTVEGMMVGTVAYMAPEQALGGTPDARSDIYSLGCIMYEMLTGRAVFEGEEALALISQHMNTAPVAPSWHNAAIPPALEALVLQMLEKDPGRRPQTATEVHEALAAIELSAPPLDGADVTTPARDPLYRRTFIGREAELRRLESAFDGALSGNGNLMMVVGEPGIGKTSVCEQLSTYVALRGGRTLVGHCYEEGSLSLPYLPFVETLRTYVLDREPAALKDELGSGAPEVARIVSEIRDRIDVEAVPPVDPAEERYRLLQSVSAFLRNASAAQPLMIVLEDLHDADRGTLDMLTYLARNLTGSRVLIVGTYRDVEVDRTHPLSGALVELRRGGEFERVLLRGLTADEVLRMLSAIAGQQVQWGLAEAVHRQTEGNPLFVQEVTRYLAEEGLVKGGHGRWQSTTENLALIIPEGLRDVIGKRLSRLSQECNRLLQVAAVVGREFALETLVAVAGVPEDALLEALEEAVRVGVLEERTRGGEVRYRFAHAFFRQSLYEELIAPRRIRMHQQVALALEEQYAGRLEEHAAELAEHFSYSSSADELSKAVRYGELAAQRASDVYAHSEAAAHLQKALEIQEVLDPADLAKRCELLVEQSEPRRLGGDVDGGRAAVLEAAEIARSTGDNDRLVTVAAAGTRYMGIIGMPDEEMDAMYAEALPYADVETDPRGARILARVADRKARMGDMEEASRLAEQAFGAAKRLQDPDAIRMAAMARLLTAVSPWQLDERYEMADEFEKAVAASGDPEQRALVCILRMGLALFVGDQGEAERQAERLAEMVDRYKLALDRRTVLGVRAELLRISGDLEESERLTRESAEAYSEINWTLLLELSALSGGSRLMLFADRGKLDEIAQGEQETLEKFQEWRYAPVRGALFHALAGNVSECRAWYERLTQQFGSGALLTDNQPGFIAAAAAEACVFLEDKAGAQDLYQFVAPFTGYCLTIRARTPGFFGPADRYLGMLASLMERWDDAERHFHDALALCEKMPTPTYLAQTQYEYARMLLKHGADNNRKRALELLAQAGEAAQRMGMMRLAEKVIQAKAEAQGISLADVKTSIDAVLESVEEERPDFAAHAAAGGHLTIMFTDIEAHTEIAERLGDKAYVAFLREHNAVVREQLATHGGHEVKNDGDGFMIVFREAGEGLRCAVAIQRALAARLESQEAIRVRIGLHTGEVIEEAADFFGKNVILAARVASLASGGEILVSGVAKELAESDGISFGEGRMVRLKGLSGSHEVWPVVWQT